MFARLKVFLSGFSGLVLTGGLSESSEGCFSGAAGAISVFFFFKGLLGFVVLSVDVSVVSGVGVGFDFVTGALSDGLLNGCFLGAFFSGRALLFIWKIVPARRIIISETFEFKESKRFSSFT